VVVASRAWSWAHTAGGSVVCPAGAPGSCYVKSASSPPAPRLAQPARDGMAGDGEMGRRVAARRDLASLEEDQSMQARPQWGIALTA